MVHSQTQNMSSSAAAENNTKISGYCGYIERFLTRSIPTEEV